MMRQVFDNMKRPVEHLRVDFWFSGRPWYVYEKGKQVDIVLLKSGVPRFVEDHGKLWEGFIAAFATIGVAADDINRSQLPNPICQRCKEFFSPQRITAKFCLKCRGSYARRNEDPQYKETNRLAVAKSKAKRQLMELNQDRHTAGLPPLDQLPLRRIVRGKK